MATKRGSLPGLKREREVAKLIFECVGPGCRIISARSILDRAAGFLSLQTFKTARIIWENRLALIKKGVPGSIIV